MTYLRLTFARKLSALSTRAPQGPGTLLFFGGLILGGGLACGLVTVYQGPWLGFLILAELVYVAAVLARPTVGVLGTIGLLYLLPFGVNPLPLGAFHPTFLDISLSVTLWAWALRVLSRQERKLVLSPLGAPLLLFLGLAVVALLFSVTLVSAERLRLFFKMVNSILFFFTILNVLRSRREVESAAQVVVLGAGTAGVLALALYVLPASASLRLLVSLGWLGYPTGDGVLRYIADTSVLRAVGTAVDPNLLGGMLMIALPLLAGQLVDRRPFLPRALLGALLLSAAAALLLSYSRSAWLGALMGLLALAVFRYRKLLLYGGLALILLLVVPQGSAFVERFRSGVMFTDRAAQMRLGEYKDAVRLVSQYPAFGVGFGEAPELDLYVAASSVYLLAAEQMGLIGLAGFIFVLGVFFWTAFRRRGVADARGLGSIQISSVAGVLGAASAGLFDHYFFNLQFPHTVALFWLFVGLATATTSEEDQGAATKVAA